MERLLIGLGFCAIFAVHARLIFTHFSSDGYLCDSGWLAFLFESGGPLLRNPSGVVGEACSGVNAASFHAHHLSPHIFFFGAPLARLFRLSGFQILACHQGLFFGLLFVSVYLVAVESIPRDFRIVATASAAVMGALSNAILQAAAYPHYEIAMIALTSLAVAACLRDHRGVFLFCLIWLPLVREDGGLYAALACMACMAVQYGSNRQLHFRATQLAILASIETLVSAGAFVLKAELFPGFDAFSKNFSGHSWNHVSVPFLMERFGAMSSNVNIAPVLAGCLLLMIYDVRYTTGLVLLAPWCLLHVLSVRPEHGHFTLYYALPWILPPIICLALFVERGRRSVASRSEAAVIGLLAATMAAPVQAAAGVRGQSWDFMRWAVSRPVTNIQAMKEFALWVRKEYSIGPANGGVNKPCMSMGIAALIPDDIHPDEVLDAGSDLSACSSVLLLRADMHYEVLSTRAKLAGFARTAEKYNAELWQAWRNRPAASRGKSTGAFERAGP